MSLQLRFLIDKMQMTTPNCEVDRDFGAVTVAAPVEQATWCLTRMSASGQWHYDVITATKQRPQFEQVNNLCNPKVMDLLVK